jgi:hypothetical protein
MPATRSAESANDAALTQYAVSGLVAATSAPPRIGASVQLTFSPVWINEFARASSSSLTRFGRPA